MFTESNLNDLQQLAAKIDAKENLLADKLRQLPKSPQDGDIFLFEQGDNLGLEWVVLFSHHKNEELLFTVPADDNPMAGSTDITISENALCGPLTLRCGQSLWIHKTDFDMKLRVGVLENKHWLRALNKVEQIFEGNLQSTAWQREKDADPEYKEWMDLLYKDHEAVRQALHDRPVQVLKTDNSKLRRPSFTFVLFLYPQHKLCLQVSWKTGKALLEQIEPPSSGALDSLQIGDHHFEFEEIEDEWLCKLSRKQVSQIARVLKLPKPYQNWETSISTKETLHKLLQISWDEKARPSVTAAQRGLMKFWLETAEGIETKFTDLCHYLFFTSQQQMSNNSGASLPKKDEIDAIINQLLTEINTTDTGVVKLSE